MADRPPSGYGVASSVPRAVPPNLPAGNLYDNISASGQARQHVGNVINNYYINNYAVSGPAATITDAALLAFGISAVYLILSVDSKPPDGVRPLQAPQSHPDTDLRLPGFRKRAQWERFFIVGRVFEVLWVEPEGVTSHYTDDSESLTLAGSKPGERPSARLRRLVVIKDGDDHSSCLSITTYSGMGVSKSGVVKSHHGIIYTGRNAPSPINAELPRRLADGIVERGLQPTAIRVLPDHRESCLDPSARINYHRIYTVQHDVEVRAFGEVKEDSMAAFRYQFNAVWALERAPAQSTSSASTEKQRRLPSPPPSTEGVKAVVQPKDPRAISNNKVEAVISVLAECGQSREQAIQYLRRSIETLGKRGLTQEQAIEVVRTRATFQRAPSNQSPGPADSDSTDGDDSDA